MATKKKAKKAIKKARPAAKKKAPVAKAKAIKKTAKRKTAKTAAQQAKAVLGLEIIGAVTHFFPHIPAGVIKLTGELKAGDMIQVKGHTTDFKQKIDSMQIDHVPVTQAKKGQEIGIKVKDRVRIGDVVYKV